MIFAIFAHEKSNNNEKKHHHCTYRFGLGHHGQRTRKERGIESQALDLQGVSEQGLGFRERPEHL